jgi:hypothetical protein
MEYRGLSHITIYALLTTILLHFRSDADEQLLLHLAFMQTVKVSSLQIGVPNDCSCPQTIKLFCNRNNLGFSEASGSKFEVTNTCIFSPFYFRSDSAPTQVINISPGTKVIKIDLNAVKWQRVESSKLSL